MGEKFRREMIVRPAYDKRDPDPSKNYGIHCCDLMMFLYGPKGTIQFGVFTGWFLPHVARELEGKPIPGHNSFKPTGFDIGYHSPVPMFDGHEPMSGECKLVEGGKCYYDGSSLGAEPILEKLIAEGSEAVWKEMEKYYEYRFEKRNG